MIPRALFALLIACICSTTALARTASIVTPAPSVEPATHGLGELERSLREKGWQIEKTATPASAHGDIVLFVAIANQLAAALPFAPQPSRPLDAAESLAVKKFSLRGKPAVLFSAADSRGLMYALLDAADSIAADDGDDPLKAIREIEERPAVRNRTLSVYTMHRGTWEARFYDEAYWKRYFDLLAASRFNRFMIVFGYENGGFLAPPYPYFFDTPGFADVRMLDLTREQQRRNLAALNRLVALAHERGIAVTLGIWDHIYRGGVQEGGADWIDRSGATPIPSSIQGVTRANINDYTLASVKQLLASVPGIDGLQFRVHEESGLSNEGMEGFWHAIFASARVARPDMLLELRGKSTPDSVIDAALDLGIDLQIETKYWMEQMGLPFHPMHVNPEDQHSTRHGYANFLRYPQRYHMDWRLWNGGTTRILLWGDPEYVRRFSASTTLYDSPNWDVQEPLATKMVARRPDLPPFELMPAKYRYYDWEFERYWHFYQLWGRLGYNPATPSEIWDREFRRRFGAAAVDIETGLHRASQVLPRIVASVYPYSLFPTTRGWAERQSLGASLAEYAANTGSDTELFESFAADATRILANGTTAKVTPEATSRWFDITADAILADARAAEAVVGERRGNEFDSTVTDLRILAQLARFHARRSLAAVHYNLYLLSRKPEELRAAAQGERDAVDAWRQLVNIAADRYASNLMFGPAMFNLDGHWRDELAKLDANLEQLDTQAKSAATSSASAWHPRTSGDLTPPLVEHARIESAPVGKPLRIVVRATDPSGVKSLHLRYRHVTQYEDYLTLDMKPTGTADEYAATIPSEFLVPEWDAMYFIEAIDNTGNGTIWPDFRREAPYIFVKLQR